MCGIAGAVDLVCATSERTLRAHVTAMTESLDHRGPDDCGVWVDGATGLGLGHRRLSIIDRSPAGAQPMSSQGGRHVLVFNGEIYNFREMRAQLNSYPFKGESDTEVLLAAIATWGFEEALSRANGMFAMAVWDTRLRTLQLARDRLGEKPLYFGFVKEWFLFASELHAIERHPSFDASLDPLAVTDFLARGYVPGPRSIFAKISKLPPASVLTLSASSGSWIASPPKQYWSITDHTDCRAVDRDDRVRMEALDGILRDAVRQRMVADVPLGAFLSGGIDSSLVVALMQAESSQPVRTFTVSMDQASHDESSDAAAVAAHLGTEHTELPLTSSDALRRVPELGSTWDEPFADPSQLPMLLLAEQTRRHVTVALTGDGGDELFAGYNRYVFGGALWWRMRRAPLPVRKLAAQLIQRVRPAVWDRLFAVASGRTTPRNAGDKMQKLASMLPATDIDDLYERLVGVWHRPGDVLGVDSPPLALRRASSTAADPVSAMMAADLQSTLPDQMLVKVDRATMAASLEARVPLLDHRVAAFAWSLPLHDKIRGGEGKWMLRRLLAHYVPSALTDRPKMGFDPPVAAWLRGPLRAWAEDMLSPASIRAEGLLEAQHIRQTWIDHLSARHNADYRLWTVLMLRAWLQARRQRVATKQKVEPPVAVTAPR